MRSSISHSGIFSFLALAACVQLIIATESQSNNEDSKAIVPRLKSFLESLSPEEWAPWARNILRDVRHGEDKVDLPCNICLGVAEALISDLQEGIELEQIIDAIVPICSTFVWDEEVCVGLMQVNVPTLAWVILNSPTFDINRFCAEGIGATDCPDYSVDPDAWTISLSDVPKPPVDRPVVPEGTEGLKILHIADIHLDQLYEVGSEADCNKAMCCQSIDGPAADNPAGIFGSYETCDIPQTTVDAAYSHILETHPDIDMVFFTGDMPAHDIWRQSIEGNNAAIAASFASMQQYFGDKTLFPVFGNHEPHPLNVYSFEGLEAPAELLTDYIYENAWSHWQTWLPADQQDNVLHSGQWSVSPREGLRVIGFNNLYGYVNNWFVWLDMPDPNGQLQWLADELQKAEDNGEHVYLLGHIPPGNHNLVPVWSHNFNKIINRYENIIRGQFYGHTHNDEFSVFFNENGDASSVAFIDPSLTTYTELNTGYRIYYVDGARGADSTWTVLDHETWLFNLEEANAAGTPNWYKFYSMKEAYGMSDLSPASYHALAERLKTDELAFDFYHRGYWKDSPRRPLCILGCRDDHICDMLTSDTSDKSRCE